MRTFIALSLAVSLAGTTGCKRIAKEVLKRRAAAHGASTTTHGSNASPGASRDDAIGDKLNAYIHCINNVSSRLHDSERRYFSWVDEKEGPTGKERNIYGVFKISDPSTCANEVAKARTAPPSLPKLEKAGDDFVAAAKKAYPLLKEANDYYSQKDYKDDKMAKGKALHPKLVAVFDDFDKADKAMRGQVHTLNRQLKERTLASLLKTQGRRIPYLRGHMMLLAQDVLHLGDVKKLEELDLPKYTAKIKEYETAVNELSAYVDGHKAEARKYMMMSSLVRKSKEYLTAAKELMRRVRDKTPYSASDKLHLGGSSAWMVNGSPGKLLHTYNDLVSRSNSVHRMR